MRCAVEGCDGAVRSKVFCARHYQQWRRNRLEGFVSPNGTVVWQGMRYSFDKRFACEPVKVTLDGDRVIYEVNGRTYKKKASVAVIGEVRRRRTSKS